jgi:RecA-family ATPase
MAALTLQMLARALGGEITGGQVLAPGPGHTAEDRSLSIKLDANSSDGFVVNSFSNDDAIVCKDYVRQKVGLPAFKPRRHGIDDAVKHALMTVAAAQKRPQPKAKIVATYDYKDADGALLYQNARHEPKSFHLRMPNGKGAWIDNLDALDGRRVLYRLTELLQYPDASVFVCEGEKDADRVAALNLCATTVACGKWTDECVQALAGRDVAILQDNDAAGVKKALEAATLLHGVANNVRIVALPDLPDKGDVSDWLDADPRRADKLADVCFAAPLWSPDQVDNRTLKNKAETPTAETTEQKETAVSLPFLNIGAWHDQPVPEREWLVKDRIPANNVTLLSGEGSVGKSILSMQLLAAVVLAKDWLKALPDPGSALGVYCEDTSDELHRRLDLIRQHYQAAYTDLKDMHLLALAGTDTLMAAPDRHGLIKPTVLFNRVHDAARDIKPKLIVLDNSADIFGGNENDRAQVRQFIGFLRNLAIEASAAVLLTSHPSLTGISNRTGLSGSTAWNASVRSRLYLDRAKTEKDEEPDPDLRVLEVMKSNYGPVGERVNLRWKDGLFVPVGGVGNLERLAAEQQADQVFMQLLGKFGSQGRNVSDKPTSHNYAPTCFARDPEAKDAHLSKTNLAAAMERLFAADKICVEDYGRPSRPASRIAVKERTE